MSSPATIRQAVLADLETGHHVDIVEGPVPPFGNDQILIKAVAFAGNPSDNLRGEGWGYVGNTTGSDVSGTVYRVGKDVSGFQVGDVVSTFVRANITKHSGGFAEYVVAEPSVTVVYPKGQIGEKALKESTVVAPGPINTWEAAASVNVSLVTIVSSFAANLKIPFQKAQNKDKTILIWGGATSVGAIGIQIAKRVYGLKVVTTASTKNASLLQSYGADKVFDYHSPSVVDEIKAYTKGSIAYALVAAPTPVTFQAVYDATADSPHVGIDNLSFLQPDLLKLDSSRNVDFVTTSAFQANGKPQQIRSWTLTASKEVLTAFNHFWKNVLPEILPTLQTLPLKVLPKGLESAEQSLALYHDNKLSGEKVVFRL